VFAVAALFFAELFSYVADARVSSSTTGT